MGINKVIISGNLTRDPEIRSMANGTSVLGWGMAVNDRVKNNQTGEWEDRPNFIDCTLFGNRADGLLRILRKGAKVAVEGKLRWSQWERDGQKRSKIEVIVDEVELMSGREGAQQPPMQPQGYQQPQQQRYAPQAAPQPVQQPQQQGYYAAPAFQQVQPQPAQQYAAQATIYDEDIPF